MLPPATIPMDDQEILEHRYRFFADRAATLAFDQDKTLVTLFTGIVAGLLALLVSKDVGFWSGLFFLMADLAAVTGLGVCLLHMAFSAKVMAALAKLTANWRNVIEDAVTTAAEREAKRTGQKTFDM